MHWYIEVLRKYVVFSGRARRKEYWFFFLISAIVSIFLAVIDEFMGWNFEIDGDDIGFLSTLYYIAIILPYLGVIIRRLHDTDRSGWWFLIAFVPLVGVIVLLVFLILRGTDGDNRYGPDPKASEASETW